MTTWPTSMYDEGSGGSHHIWHIKKVYFTLEAAAPSHVYHCGNLCVLAMSSTLSHHQLISRCKNNQ